MNTEQARNELAELLSRVRESELSSPELVKSLATEAVERAKALQDAEATVHALNALAYAEQLTGNYQRAFDLVIEALETCPSDWQMKASVLLRFASLSSDLGSDNVALLALNSLEGAADPEVDKGILLRVLVSMSTSYLRQQQPDLALQKLGEAMYLADSLHDERSMYWCIHSTGIARAKRGEYRIAIPLYETARRYYVDTKQYYNTTAIDMLLGEAYLHVDVARARYYLDVAVESARQHGFELLATQASISLADYHRATGDVEEALRCLERARDLLAKSHDTKSSKMLREALSRHYEKLGNYREALAYLKAEPKGDFK